MLDVVPIRVDNLKIARSSELSANANDALAQVLFGDLRIGDNFVLSDMAILPALSEIIFGVHKIAFYVETQFIAIGEGDVTFPINRLDRGRVRLWMDGGELVTGQAALSEALGACLMDMMRRVRSERPDIWAQLDLFRDYSELWLTRLFLAEGN